MSDHGSTDTQSNTHTHIHLVEDIWLTGADRYTQTNIVADIWRRMWTILVPGCHSLSWRRLGGQVRTGADNSRPGVSLYVGGHLADIGSDRFGQLWYLGVSLSFQTFAGQVRTCADNSISWVSL